MPILSRVPTLKYLSDSIQVNPYLGFPSPRAMVKFAGLAIYLNTLAKAQWLVVAPYIAQHPGHMSCTSTFRGGAKCFVHSIAHSAHLKRPIHATNRQGSLMSSASQLS